MYKPVRRRGSGRITDDSRAEVDDGTERDDPTERVWMVERTFSDDSPHILVVIYATPDGSRYLQKEHAFNRFWLHAGAGGDRGDHRPC